MTLSIEQRLTGSRAGHIATEFFNNAVHFPLVNLVLELLLEDLPGFFAEPDAYILIVAPLVQALVAGTWSFRGRPRPLLGNLIGPAVYTAAEVSVEGLGFFGTPYHLADWGFALAIGLWQTLQRSPRRGMADLFLVLESVTRTAIPLAIYWIYEAISDERYRGVAAFFSDESHALIAIILPLIGLVLGFARLQAAHADALLRETAGTLRGYSEWLLGPLLLSQAVADPGALLLQRRQRSMLFMDIRGFTHWSETRQPEQVVAMLNEYFHTAEGLWRGTNVIKIYFTADEIMAVFPHTADAARVALAFQQQIGAQTAQHGLGVGIGINTGPVVEGLMGSRDIKEYNVIGDSVNTAKRICDQAQAGEVLLSQAALDDLAGSGRVGPPRHITAKGKREPLAVYPLLALAE